MALADPQADHWIERIPEPDARLVLEALADEAYDFRTIDGIVSSTQLSAERIKQIIDQYPDLVRLSPAPGPGRAALYTLKSRPMSVREGLATAQSVVASPVRS